MKYNNLLDLVGNTPLFELKNIKKELGLKANLFAKLESFNPSGSVKDRAAMYMILDAEEKGLLVPGSTIIEPTSGNTGIGLASIGVTRGYRVILTMPESMSIERRKLLKAYGAEIVLTDKAEGMAGAISKAKELNAQIKNSVILGQFDNKANVKAHYETTGEEIYKDLNGKVDIFVAGIGTGGTITGCAKYLKSKNKEIKVVGVEPSTSPFLSEGKKGPHKIQGIGAGFAPAILILELIDEISPISNEDALEYARKMGKTEGFLIGISSGAALAAAIKEAKKEENKDKNIVVIFPDNADKYLSTELFLEE